MSSGLPDIGRVTTSQIGGLEIRLARGGRSDGCSQTSCLIAVTPSSTGGISSGRMPQRRTPPTSPNGSKESTARFNRRVDACEMEDEPEGGERCSTTLF